MLVWLSGGERCRVERQTLVGNNVRVCSTHPIAAVMLPSLSSSESSRRTIGEIFQNKERRKVSLRHLFVTRSEISGALLFSAPCAPSDKNGFLSPHDDARKE